MFPVFSRTWTHSSQQFSIKLAYLKFYRHYSRMQTPRCLTWCYVLPFAFRFNWLVCQLCVLKTQIFTFEVFSAMRQKNSSSRTTRAMRNPTVGPYRPSTSLLLTKDQWIISSYVGWSYFHSIKTLLWFLVILPTLLQVRDDLSAGHEKPNDRHLWNYEKLQRQYIYEAFHKSYRFVCTRIDSRMPLHG